MTSILGGVASTLGTVLVGGLVGLARGRDVGGEGLELEPPQAESKLITIRSMDIISSVDFGLVSSEVLLSI